MNVTDNVKSNLTKLKRAVIAVTTANKSWLQALGTFIEGISGMSDPGRIAAEITKALPTPPPSPGTDSNQIVDQAMRLALDEVTLLQLADRKLEGKVAQLDSTSENLGKALVESEAYLVVTDGAFKFLKQISGITKIDFTPADTARTKLVTQVATLLQSSGQTGGATLPPPEPDGTELLLGKNLGAGADEFLALLLQAGVKETLIQQTQKLLSGGRLTLSDKQINALTNSWGKAVQQATDDLADATSPFTIADLFGIHTTLDTLYDRLETNVTRTDVDIVSLEI